MGILVDQLINELEVRETKSLLQHEQVISYNLKKLKEAMLNTAYLVDPLIIDKKTSLVLDGNHRLKVLEIIECPLASCQVVDYDREDIQVGTWYPATKLSPDQIFKLDSIKYEKVDHDHGKKAVDDLKAPFMLSTKKENYLLNPGNYKLREMVEEQNYIMSLVEKSNNVIEYIPDQEISSQLDESHSIFYRRAYTKSEIIKAAQDHAPLPPKSTRHTIPGRIIRLNMRLGWLHNSKKEADEELKRMLTLRAYAGNVRKYYEPVVVIY
ncbi:MAG: hypothetical protein ABIJ34_09110 [archaeon]|nr:hypothetical protein [Candidatus Micrarchaeota archaeon]MBU1166166.1 hypothetical protein [Candidatus Micrarchaeota archaeon]MBU1886564.1 hypothetical protein [Candidatus Micrarchaeota archaeon]